MHCVLMMCALPMQPEIDYNKVLVVHNASSCTHPANYYNLMKTIVYPYWAADPPEHRLSKKNYKKVDHPTAFVPEDSLKFKVRHAGRHMSDMDRRNTKHRPYSDWWHLGFAYAWHIWSLCQQWIFATANCYGSPLHDLC